MSWRDQLSEDALQILESSESDHPSAERLEKIAAGLAAVTVGATAVAGVTSALGTATSGAPAAGAAAGAAGTTGAVGGASAAVASTGTWVALATPVKLLLAVLAVAGSATGYQALRADGSPAGASSDTAQTSVAQPSSGTNVAGIIVEQEPIEEPERNEEEPAESERTTASAARPRRRVPSPEAATPIVDSAGEELRMTQQIQHLVEENPAEALRLIASARTQAGTRFAPERELYSIEALARLQRRSEVQQAARRFEARFPRSPYLERVRALAANQPNQPPITP